MKEKLVSIIMNCFNGEKFIEESLRSIVNQKYQNWELIFLDNNSNDNSAKIFKKFKDKRFFYFKNNKTTNISIARNKAISLCNGEYLSFFDKLQNNLDITLSILLPTFLKLTLPSRKSESSSFNNLLY
mgnify:CR=1 FL=1